MEKFLISLQNEWMWEHHKAIYQLICEEFDAVSNKALFFFKLISLGLDLNIIIQAEHCNLKVLSDDHAVS